MGCTGNKGPQDKQINDQIAKIKQLVSAKQLKLLHMIFTDLSSRISQQQLSLQNFLLFFHKNGYWGDRLFKQFDTNASQLISEEQFIKGIVKIFKTKQDSKIQLLYKFFSKDQGEPGISFSALLIMLYNYPKEDLKQILNDPQFINTELKSNLVAVDSDLINRRLMSVCPNDVRNDQIQKTRFRLQQNSEFGDQRLESRVGAHIINEMNKKKDGKGMVLKLKVGQNNIQVKTTSLHYLVKKFAKSIFTENGIDPKKGRLSYDQFKVWIQKHPKLYNDYYSGFHNQAWQVDDNNQPLYMTVDKQYQSEARLQYDHDKMKKVIIYLINSVLIICEEAALDSPIKIVCLEGLSVTYLTNDENNKKGCGIQIQHRDGIYQTVRFYVKNQKILNEWQSNLKYFDGASINQLYEWGKKIGVGKFSVVYDCKQKPTSKQSHQRQLQHFAIKVIQKYKLDDQAKKLIAHESSIMSILSHPLLVFFKQSLQTKTHIYIVTELVKGKQMFEFVKQGKYLDQSQAAYIIQQIIIGIRYIHSLGIVHRDLKPQNVMIQYNQETNELGRIKIIDFGFANYLSKLQLCPMQELLAGTPNYIAPQILRGEPITEKIDNFAIGSILYFAVSGSLPFNSYDVSSILQKTLEGAYTVNGFRWRDISTECKDLVQKLLQGEPQRRISLSDALNHDWFKKFGERKGLKHQSNREKNKMSNLQF